MAFMVEEGGAQVLFIDMDDMKHINDRFGHDRGDEAIRAAAGILRDACGRRDFIMRYGGDEFLVIASTREGDLKSRILEAADEFNRGVPYSLQLSIGIVRPVRGDNLSLDEWVKIADAQMYETKKRRKAAAGRNEE